MISTGFGGVNNLVGGPPPRSIKVFDVNGSGRAACARVVYLSTRDLEIDLSGAQTHRPSSLRRNLRGGHPYTDHPGVGLTDAYAASIPDFPFRPGVHVNDDETRLRIKDGLPKMKDPPAEMGGSGSIVAQ